MSDFEDYPLYRSAIKHLEVSQIPVRMIRTEMVNCGTDLEYLAKIHCIRLAFQYLFKVNPANCFTLRQMIQATVLHVSGGIDNSMGGRHGATDPDWFAAVGRQRSKRLPHFIWGDARVPQGPAELVGHREGARAQERESDDLLRHRPRLHNPRLVQGFGLAADERDCRLPEPLSFKRVQGDCKRVCGN